MAPIERRRLRRGPLTREACRTVALALGTVLALTAAAMADDIPAPSRPAPPPVDQSSAPTPEPSQDARIDQLRTEVDTLMAQGRNHEAQDDLDTILGILPDDPIALNDRGLARWRSLDFRTTSAEPVDGFALLKRGLCREISGDCPDVALALADLARAIVLLPGKQHVVPLVNRAGILIERGRIKEGLADYDEAIRLSPSDVPVLILRAEAREKAGDETGARADLEEALRLRPHDAQALAQRARMLQQSGDLDGARADLDDALRQPVGNDSPEWLGQARNLRRALARPSDPGMETELKDLAISGVGVTRDASGQDVVTLTLAPDAAHRFGDFTTAHVGAITEILVDGTVVVAPRILIPILGGSLQISGAFSHDDAMALATRIKGQGTGMTVRVGNER